MSNIEQLREALLRISEIAAEAGSAAGEGYTAEIAAPALCTPKSLPQSLLVAAAKTATDINPVNAPMMGPMASLGADFVLEPLQIAVLTAKYWGPTPRRLSVSFMESTPSALRDRIIGHMNAWNQKCGVQFVGTNGLGQVRISRAPGGYWSYLGTDIFHIPQNRQTMNLQNFTMNTPESEFKRVVRHETGHTLGFPHEHMRRQLVALIDRQKAYDYFLRTQNWSQAMVDAQVLTPLDDQSIMGTAPDQTSIMCYQLPGAITKNGQPIIGGVDINATDYAFAARIYPKPGAATIEHDPLVDAEGFDQATDYEWSGSAAAASA